jgi:hypothetical protein
MDARRIKDSIKAKLKNRVMLVLDLLPEEKYQSSYL